MAPIPKYAATVILIRKIKEILKDSNFEVLLIKRAEEMKFLGGHHAFPGGKLEEQDYWKLNLKRCKGHNIDQMYKILYDKNTSFEDKRFGLSFWIAAIREVFEEVGILLAYKDGKLIDLSSDPIIKRFRKHRKNLILNQSSMLEIMENEDLYYAVDRLHYFRHFITPPISPIRYDARFFLAKIPDGQRKIDLNTKEITDYEWLTPKESLRKYRKKEIKIIPPQYACLKGLMNKNYKDLEIF